MPPGVLAIGFPEVNRGVAVLDDMVFVGTLNAHLVGLDAALGDRSLGRRGRRTTRSDLRSPLRHWP